MDHSATPATLEDSFFGTNLQFAGDDHWLNRSIGLGWGRSYISQLLTKQKSLRIEQVLLILDVIGVDPGDFFAELYHYPRISAGTYRSGRLAPTEGSNSSEQPGNFEEMRSLVRGLVWLLIDKELIDVDELTSAVKERKDGPSLSGEMDDSGPAN